MMNAPVVSAEEGRSSLADVGGWGEERELPSTKVVDGMLISAFSRIV